MECTKKFYVVLTREAYRDNVFQFAKMKGWLGEKGLLIKVVSEIIDIDPSEMALDIIRKIDRTVLQKVSTHRHPISTLLALDAERTLHGILDDNAIKFRDHRYYIIRVKRVKDEQGRINEVIDSYKEINNFQEVMEFLVHQFIRKRKSLALMNK